MNERSVHGSWQWPDDPNKSLNERIADEVAAVKAATKRLQESDPRAPVIAERVRFTCTDSGHHPSREVGLLTRYYDDDVAVPGDALQPMSSRLAKGKRDRPGERGVVAKGRITHEGRGILLGDAHIELRCPTCNRCLQWRIMRAINIVDTLVQARRFRVDISALPANLT